MLLVAEPSLGEEEKAALAAVIDAGWITMGERVRAFETAFAEAQGAPDSVAVSSATAGLHLALAALGIGPGDEVLVPSATFVATANVILHVGATPVFVDVDRDTLMTDAARIEAAITPRTRAIIPVHYAGAACDMDPIDELALRHGIAVIEDAAHAAGTLYRGRPVGQRGTAIFSFHAIKNLTCAEGGMFVTDDEALANRVRTLKFHGLGVDAYDRLTHGRKPQAQVVEPGFKYNLTDINAAIALAQLPRLEAINARRAELAKAYAERLAHLPAEPLALPDYPQHHAWHLYILRIDQERCGIDRDAFMQGLQQRGIGTGIHFIGSHLHSYYRQRYPRVQLPNTEWNSSRIVSIPLFPDMTQADQDRVVDAIETLLR